MHGVKKTFAIFFISFFLNNILFSESITDLYIDHTVNPNKIELALNALDYVSGALKIIATPNILPKEFLFFLGLDAFNKFLIGCNECSKLTKVSCLVGSKNFLYSVNDIIDMAVSETKNLSEEDKLMQFIWLNLNKFMPISICSVGHLYWFGGNFGKPFFDSNETKGARKLSSTYMHYIGIDIPF